MNGNTNRNLQQLNCDYLPVVIFSNLPVINYSCQSTANNVFRSKRDKGSKAILRMRYYLTRLSRGMNERNIC